MWTSLVYLFLCICGCLGQIDTTEEYPHFVALNQDKTMLLFWKFDEIYITFEVDIDASDCN